MEINDGYVMMKTKENSLYVCNTHRSHPCELHTYSMGQLDYSAPAANLSMSVQETV